MSAEGYTCATVFTATWEEINERMCEQAERPRYLTYFKT